ncbi:MAG: hypothetical protein DRN81_01260 [Thermoproteota archaeon]|nr:MAG: hypothetical protein DRN81_01260 [Candidatus Korarchaeota archaeon]
MLKQELKVLAETVDVVVQEINDSIEECGGVNQIPIQNAISLLTAVHEFNKKFNEFIEAHHRNGSFKI